MMEDYPRLLDPPRASFFLFGPRGVGKSTWLRATFPAAHRVDPRSAGTCSRAGWP